jgi:hypothetical protein
VVVLAPYPNNPNPVESFNVKNDFDLQGRPGAVSTFFNCNLCPTGAKGTVHSGSHKELSLMYFSMFEPIELTLASIMQQSTRIGTGAHPQQTLGGDIIFHIMVHIIPMKSYASVY